MSNIFYKVIWFSVSVLCFLLSGTNQCGPNEQLKKGMRNLDFEAVKKALKEGADPNTVMRDNRTVLGHAAYAGRLDIVESLINAGANPNMMSYGGLLPIDEAYIEANELSSLLGRIRKGRERLNRNQEYIRAFENTASNLRIIEENYRQELDRATVYIDEYGKLLREQQGILQMEKEYASQLAAKKPGEAYQHRVEYPVGLSELLEQIRQRREWLAHTQRNVMAAEDYVSRLSTTRTANKLKLDNMLELIRQRQRDVRDQENLQKEEARVLQLVARAQQYKSIIRFLRDHGSVPPGELTEEEAEKITHVVPSAVLSAEDAFLAGTTERALWLSARERAAQEAAERAEQLDAEDIETELALLPEDIRLRKEKLNKHQRKIIAAKEKAAELKRRGAFSQLAVQTEVIRELEKDLKEDQEILQIVEARMLRLSEQLQAQTRAAQEEGEPTVENAPFMRDVLPIFQAGEGTSGTQPRHFRQYPPAVASGQQELRTLYAQPRGVPTEREREETQPAPALTRLGWGAYGVL